MKIRFTNGNEIHVERGIGEALVLGGMATEIINDGGARPPSEPACRVEWTLTAGVQSGVPIIRGTCDACKISAYGAGRDGARQVSLWHRGRQERPSQSLVAQVFALPEESRWTQSGGVQPFESLQASGDPFRDYQTITNGKRPADPPPGPVAQSLSGQKDIDT